MPLKKLISQNFRLKLSLLLNAYNTDGNFDTDFSGNTRYPEERPEKMLKIMNLPPRDDIFTYVYTDETKC